MQPLKITFQNIFKELQKHLLYNIERRGRQYLRLGTWQTCKKNSAALSNIYNNIASLYFKYMYAYINK